IGRRERIRAPRRRDVPCSAGRIRDREPPGPRCRRLQALPSPARGFSDASFGHKYPPEDPRTPHLDKFVRSWILGQLVWALGIRPRILGRRVWVQASIRESSIERAACVRASEALRCKRDRRRDASEARSARPRVAWYIRAPVVAHARAGFR